MTAKKNKRRSGSHLTASDRYRIFDGIHMEESHVKTAEDLGVDPTTVAKEIKLHRRLIQAAHHL